MMAQQSVSPSFSPNISFVPSLGKSETGGTRAKPHRALAQGGNARAEALVAGFRKQLERGGAGLVSALVVGGLFSALVFIGAGPMVSERHRSEIVSVSLMSQQSAPKPAPAKAQEKPAAAQPHAATAPVPAPVQAAAQPTAATPQPLALAPSQVSAPAAAAAPAPAPAAASGSASAAPVAPSGPVDGGDLSARLVSFKAPSYPMESRRQHEQGTVFLRLLVDTEGHVSEIGIDRSSGSSRLDKAALDAVRHWRWAPMMVRGEAVMVRGVVKIPFVLQG
ncbi:TonB family protein [Novosphingobium nitrogenifigens DSM 19370]|uniref:TonB family protein n=2 Tax=Novosphingobium nitrogenifigens TaxID=378548 RepID=F1Z9N4_9SPHN|nr:energy transducer TonB [Novosphingobium nitrogenifigens]EGD58708.1 TonB family protein [Novosphingobium nitrogenifigens DSM 19370]